MAKPATLSKLTVVGLLAALSLLLVGDSIRAPGGAGRIVAVVDTALLFRGRGRARSRWIGPMASGWASGTAGGICRRVSDWSPRSLVPQRWPPPLGSRASSRSVDLASGCHGRNQTWRPTGLGAPGIRWPRIDGRTGLLMALSGGAIQSKCGASVY